MDMYDLVIKGGTVVNAGEEFRADIGVKGGKIACIADRLEGGKEVIDAAGKLVIPGGIDLHTHLDAFVHGTRTLDDWYQGTVSAACGGVTCVVDYAMQEKGHTLRDIINKWSENASSSAVVDYSFSPILLDRSVPGVYDEIPQLIKDGFPLFKVFMAYAFRVDDTELIKLIDLVSSNGGILGVHCENDWAIDYLAQKLIKSGKTDAKYHPISRPPVVETDATSRLIRLAEMVDGRVFVVHLSAKGALKAVRKAREEGRQVYAETCPHFLVLDEKVYDQPLEEAAKFVVTPPMRTEEHQQALWNGIRTGDISILSSDHCAFSLKEKLRLGTGNFTTIPHGAPGVEARVPVMFSEGVSKGRITAQKFVEVVSTNPAKLAGMYPQKGVLAVGSDADIVLIDPNKEVTMSTAKMHSNCDFSPYEGMRLKGYPVMTLSRGVVVCKDGDVVAKRGHGKLVSRSPFQPF